MSEDKPIIPEVPFVYREDGYLVLTLSIRKGEVHFFSTRDGGKSHDLSFPRFMARMAKPEPPCNPYRFALNILGQQSSGILRVRARDERKILAMLQKSPEELEKLDPAQLGREYARLVGKEPPADKPKSKLVKELLMSVEHQVAATEAKEQKDDKDKPAPPAGDSAPSTPPAGEGAAAAPATDTKKEKEKVSKTKKKAAPAKPDKKKAAPAKPVAAPKKNGDKKPAAAKAPAKKGDGPFRDGSKKAKAYAFFKSSGGDREKVIKFTVGLGCTEATARSWYSVFCKVNGK